MINKVYLTRVSVTHVAILREVRYRRWKRRCNTKVCEPKYRCKILSFKNVYFKICIKIKIQLKN